MTDLHYAGLLEVSRLIRRRAVSAVEVCRAQLARIERLDGRLNSVLTVLPDQALAQAETADREIVAGLWRGPLHGVPIGLKDLLYTKGVPTSAGMAIHKAFVPDYDATVVKKLAQAGAVTIGKLHMTEGATMSHHPSLPRPDNPWKSGHWTGVSSSGSGVAPAAGLCYGALGSDTGGSIRMPSAACGLSGIKPTWGRVSRRGVFPLAESFDHIGPMARSVADAAAILRVISGVDADDTTALPDPVPDYLAGIDGGVDGLVIGVDWAFATENVDPAVADGFTSAMAVLESLGARIRPIVFPDSHPMEVMSLLMAEVGAAHADTFPARAEDYGPDLRAMLEGAAQISGIMAANAMNARLRFNGELGKVFDQVDIIATPTLPSGAPTWDEVDAMGLQGMMAGLMRYTLPLDMSGSPTLSVPCGQDHNGMPISLQLIGRRLGEATLCRAGHAYQMVTDFHTRRPPLA